MEWLKIKTINLFKGRLKHTNASQKSILGSMLQLFSIAKFVPVGSKRELRLIHKPYMKKKNTSAVFRIKAA
jgi:hypothetical protein